MRYRQILIKFVKKIEDFIIVDQLIVKPINSLEYFLLLNKLD
jgi:hypothetical protein